MSAFSVSDLFASSGAGSSSIVASDIRDSSQVGRTVITASSLAALQAYLGILTNAGSGDVRSDGTVPFVAPQTGVSATAATHLATKGQMDAALAAAVALLMPRSGGAFTGPVVLPGLPTSALHAVTKGYVDSLAVAGGALVPLQATVN